MLNRLAVGLYRKYAGSGRNLKKSEDSHSHPIKFANKVGRHGRYKARDEGIYYNDHGSYY